jgi:hypothetical protein
MQSGISEFGSAGRCRGRPGTVPCAAWPFGARSARHLAILAVPVGHTRRKEKAEPLIPSLSLLSVSPFSLAVVGIEPSSLLCRRSLLQLFQHQSHHPAPHLRRSTAPFLHSSPSLEPCHRGRLSRHGQAATGYSRPDQGWTAVELGSGTARAAAMPLPMCLW